MITIIAGSRSLGEHHLQAALKNYKLPITKVICGCANGIDKAGFNFARSRRIPVAFFPAWTYQYSWALMNKKPMEHIYYPRGGYKGSNSKLYGFQRNEAMAKFEGTEALLAVWGNSSGGTRNMIELAEENGLVVTVHKV